ncbi:MAG TPA: M1 family peptidase [Flavobacteriaceae bacterium]|nr:M1 family peptidase [Flavobacteriaceae bacterium]HIN98281.1 M1 family peptidase [Flavobacteriaceae bacterium]
MKYLILFLCTVATCFSQQTEVVDFKKVTALIFPSASEQNVKGEYILEFEILKNTDSVFVDAKNMTLRYFSADGIEAEATDDALIFRGNFKAGQTYKVNLSYTAEPKQTLYFTGNQIWTQGQGKYTSHWLPSIDDMNDKIEFDIQYFAEKGETVVANGKLYDSVLLPPSKTYRFDMQKPMASYLVAFAMGNYKKRETVSNSGVPIELYLSEEDTANFEPTYRYTKEIFDFLETEIGVSYPWQNYKQVPVRDFLYAGMENTTATIFSEAFVVDSIAFVDRNYVNVNAHELAHQWFGNLVTETSGTHHWLQEGFATYYALLAEREIYGDDYYYWKLYQTAEQLKSLSDEGKGQSLLDPNASSLTFYEKGAWALHTLRELIGNTAFRKAIQTYLAKYSFKNVTTENFLDEVRAATTMDISAWEKDWLQQTAFKAEQAFNSLLKSSFIKKYFELNRLAALPLSEKKIQLTTALTFPDDFIGQEAVYQLVGEPIEETVPLYKKGFESKNILVRQAIALSLAEIPIALKTDYESLLNDASYVTQEAALYGLWTNFPEDRAMYLDAMKNSIGFQDKNIRQLWLTLAIVSPAYNETAKPRYIDELRSYTSPAYSFEVRQKAFGYINEIQLYDETVVNNLVNASVHHNWRFRNTARQLLDEVLKNPGIKEALKRTMNSFTNAEKNYLSRIFSEQ